MATVIQMVWLGGLIAGTTYISWTYKTWYAAQRPIESAIIALLLTATALTTRRLLLPTWPVSSSTTSKENNGSIPLQEVHPHTSRRHAIQPHRSSSARLDLHWLRVNLVLLLLGICLRVEILRQIINHSGCARGSLGAFIPVGLALVERKAKSEPVSTTRTRTSPASIDRYAPLGWSSLLMLSFSIASYMALSHSVSSPQSTYICARTTLYRQSIPLLQIAGTLLDIGILAGLDRLCDRINHVVLRASARNMSESAKALSVLSLACLSASIVLVIVGFLPWLPDQYRWWHDGFATLYTSEAFFYGAAIALAAMCAFEVWCWTGATLTCSIVIYAVTNCSVLFAALNLHKNTMSTYRRTSQLYSILAMLLLVLIFRRQVQVSQSDAPFRARHAYALLLICFIVSIPLGIHLGTDSTGRSPLQTHPIFQLMSRANNHATMWAHEASTSQTVDEAAANYRRRYGRDPPPRFDAWYQFAISKGSVVIDDYDNVNSDLLPFWALSSEEIRQRTWEAISNPWNDVMGIIIRDGNITIREGTPELHAWMEVGIADMIRPFAQWLPDMDLAFNKNDEPRIAIPFKEMELLRDESVINFQSSSTGKFHDFSSDRAQTWRLLPEEPVTDTRFIERSWHATWEEFSTIGCSFSPIARADHKWGSRRGCTDCFNPPAIRDRLWDFRRVCTDCVNPHTFYGFVSNWTLAADPCHQPDLAHLHGLHLAPSAFKGTHDLMPIFSQSKAAGYADILYPSPWNYLDRAKYAPNESYPDPLFAEKEGTLFWRGGTSEGVSAFDTGVWQGMVRQRLTWLFNNASATDGYTFPMLLPVPGSRSPDRSVPRFQPHAVTRADLEAHIPVSLDIRIPTDISRCNGWDCTAQYLEFSPQYVAPIDFQTHWQYKYLMDVDGAGFSGRFIPFLKSRSLVFKASIFREWWHGRLTAWQHFVPVDVRLQELAGLVAFFGGWRDGDANGAASENQDGDGWLMKPHEEEAERIAEAGRQQAGKVLRKEDMEVYMFRLLLEWGRVTDDARDELGWSGGA